MKVFRWNQEKNELLKYERNISFEEIMVAIDRGSLVDTINHDNKTRYPNQRIFVVAINHYMYLVPFVENENGVFLKTIIPSRKATKKYLIDKQ